MLAAEGGQGPAGRPLAAAHHKGEAVGKRVEERSPGVRVAPRNRLRTYPLTCAMVVPSRRYIVLSA